MELNISNLLEATYLNAFALSQNIEIQIGQTYQFEIPRQRNTFSSLRKINEKSMISNLASRRYFNINMTTQCYMNNIKEAKGLMGNSI